MELVTRHWSGKHKQVVCGINLITLMWTDGDSRIPCDYRLYNKQHDGDDHFQALIATAHQRGFTPECVVFDSWYSSLKISKRFDSIKIQLKSNRHVNLDKQGNRPIRELPISATGTIVHLKGYGLIKVFRIVSRNIEYWATSNLSMNDLYRLKYAEFLGQFVSSQQFVGVERCFARKAIAQRKLAWHCEPFSVWSDTVFQKSWLEINSDKKN